PDGAGRFAAAVLAPGRALGGEAGGGVGLGRNLNARDDRELFGSAGWPIVEGKQLDPFVANVEAAAQFVDGRVARRLLGARAGRSRLAYREVASATNRLTLIAAILPAHTVTTHTIFCLREPLPI